MFLCLFLPVTKIYDSLWRHKPFQLFLKVLSVPEAKSLGFQTAGQVIVFFKNVEKINLRKIKNLNRVV